MSCTRRRALIILSGSVFTAAANGARGSTAAQSELVIFKEGTTFYHRPGCPEIRDVTDILALSKGQAELRGYKPHPACDPSNPNAKLSPQGHAKTQPPVTVYVDGPKYYHRQSCAKLDATAKSLKSIPLQQAAKTHWPCPLCKAPVYKKNTDAVVLGTNRRRGG